MARGTRRIQAAGPSGCSLREARRTLFQTSESKRLFASLNFPSVLNASPHDEAEDQEQKPIHGAAANEDLPEGNAPLKQLVPIDWFHAEPLAARHIHNDYEQTRTRSRA